MKEIMSATRTYKAWEKMKARCYNKNFPQYRLYGGRGISVCPEWKQNPQAFISDMGQMPENCNSLARINENLDFSKDNCRWSAESSGRRKIKKDKESVEEERRLKLRDPKHIGLVIERDHLDFIKRQALQKSLQMGRIIQPNELIREALQVAFPAPKQYDMFGDKK